MKKVSQIEQITNNSERTEIGKSSHPIVGLEYQVDGFTITFWSKHLQNLLSGAENPMSTLGCYILVKNVHSHQVHWAGILRTTLISSLPSEYNNQSLWILSRNGSQLYSFLPFCCLSCCQRPMVPLTVMLTMASLLVSLTQVHFSLSQLSSLIFLQLKPRHHFCAKLDWLPAAYRFKSIFGTAFQALHNMTPTQTLHFISYWTPHPDYHHPTFMIQTRGTSNSSLFFYTLGLFNLPSAWNVPCPNECLLILQDPDQISLSSSHFPNTPMSE